jgi:hypothetical protein
MFYTGVTTGTTQVAKVSRIDGYMVRQAMQIGFALRKLNFIAYQITYFFAAGILSKIVQIFFVSA